MSQQPSPADTPSMTSPPGERLRQARETRGYTLHDVAANLKIDAGKLADIERGNVAGLGAPVFVSGYLRAYAKLLDLPADEIAGEFLRSTDIKPPSFDPASSPVARNYGKMGRSSSEQPLSGDSGWLHPGIVLIVIAVLLVGGYFSWTRFNAFELVAELDTPGGAARDDTRRIESVLPGLTAREETVSTIPEPVATTPAGNTTESAQDTVPVTNAPADSAFARSTVEPDDNANTNANSSAPIRTADSSASLEEPASSLGENPVITLLENRSQPSGARTISVVPLNADSGSRVSSASGQTAAVDEGIRRNATTAQDLEEIKLFLTEESWVEVTDAEGERLVYQLGKPGDVFTVEGVQPFSVMLGYVPAVRILFNGDPYDLSAYDGRRSVRFQLRGQAEG